MKQGSKRDYGNKPVPARLMLKMQRVRELTPEEIFIARGGDGGIVRTNTKPDKPEGAE